MERFFDLFDKEISARIYFNQKWMSVELFRCFAVITYP